MEYDSIKTTENLFRFYLLNQQQHNEKKERKKERKKESSERRRMKRKRKTKRRKGADIKAAIITLFGIIRLTFCKFYTRISLSSSLPKELSPSSEKSSCNFESMKLAISSSSSNTFRSKISMVSSALSKTLESLKE